MTENNKRGRPDKGVSRVVVSLDDNILNNILAMHDRKYGFLSRKVNELLSSALTRQQLEKPVKTGKLRK